jgi:hypothetical protein
MEVHIQTLILVDLVDPEVVEQVLLEAEDLALLVHQDKVIMEELAEELLE